jgi:lysyl-tRNA synthetase class II
MSQITENLENLRQEWIDGGDAYPNDIDCSHRRSAESLHLNDYLSVNDPDSMAEWNSICGHTTVIGRVILRRVMGKMSFITLRDETGDIQCAIQRVKKPMQHSSGSGTLVTLFLSLVKCSTLGR